MHYLTLFLPRLCMGLLLAFSSVMASSCSLVPVYRMPIEQGQKIDPSLIKEKIKKGVSRQEVRAVLGEPTLLNPCDPDSWHYVYTYQSHLPGSKPVYQELLLIFKQDRVIAIPRNSFSNL